LGRGNGGVQFECGPEAVEADGECFGPHPVLVQAEIDTSAAAGEAGGHAEDAAALGVDLAAGDGHG
jgi:hypothetical protein